MPTKRQKKRSKKKNSNLLSRYGVGRFQVVQSILINVVTFPIRIFTSLLSYTVEFLLVAPLGRHRRRKK